VRSTEAWLCLPLLAVGCGKSEGRTGLPPVVTSDAGISVAAGGLPCDVAQFLQAKCDACHSSPPTAGAPMPLMTYADLVSRSRSDASKTNARLAVDRMRSASAPMPPATYLSGADIAILADWVAAGAPAATCQPEAAASDAGNPDTSPTCSSGTYWPGGEGSAVMQPGVACISCHSGVGAGDEQSGFGIAGTAYKTLHEPNGCNGAPNALIEVTDANGQVISLSSNAAGNFYAGGVVAFPIRARVTANGVVREMLTPQASGNCNACHTQTGDQGAPGRVMLP
jgi:cytochrome c553